MHLAVKSRKWTCDLCCKPNELLLDDSVPLIEEKEKEDVSQFSLTYKRENVEESEGPSCP